MTLDDLKKLATSGTIFNLDRMIAPKIIKMLYLLGLGTIAIWAIRHLFGTFGQSFADGIWGLLEIGVIGLGSFVLLRVICETLLVFFKKNEEHVTLAASVRPATSIFDDVKDALEELAEDDVEFEEQKAIEPTPKKAPAKKPAAKRAPARKRTTAARSRTTKAKSE
ncbi:DUF4282 domain-containing protein [Maritalea porphyrae]|uniref:DUF4282 domain-containing protein n=1 Tax=Maritalea porphyrae TaxID=880732 RepID=A0ABQ5UU53_9HYPH|nr:DUF4282 domain-containing protein [Maritalea porphyrae]GLQ18661.1 hypothetical protein GCM10007879_29100 [Maritalea porphyrae]